MHDLCDEKQLGPNSGALIIPTTIHSIING
jgi:hypothetical protein